MTTIILFSVMLGVVDKGLRSPINLPKLKYNMLNVFYGKFQVPTVKFANVQWWLSIMLHFITFSSPWSIVASWPYFGILVMICLIHKTSSYWWMISMIHFATNRASDWQLVNDSNEYTTPLLTFIPHLWLNSTLDILVRDKSWQEYQNKVMKLQLIILVS